MSHPHYLRDPSDLIELDRESVGPSSPLQHPGRDLFWSEFIYHLRERLSVFSTGRCLGKAGAWDGGWLFLCHLHPPPPSPHPPHQFPELFHFLFTFPPVMHSLALWAALMWQPAAPGKASGGDARGRCDFELEGSSLTNPSLAFLVRAGWEETSKQAERSRVENWNCWVEMRFHHAGMAPLCRHCPTSL